jgi:hypothetical protein
MTEDIPDIDIDKLCELMEDYRGTGSESRRREIENDVLDETVWKLQPDEYILTKRQLWILQDRIDDEVANRIFKQLFVQKL